MSVTKTQEWTAIVSGDPSGTVTIGAGTNKTLILAQTTERSNEYTASAAIGNQPFTGVGDLYHSTTADSIQLKYWYWDDVALESMSGNTISYSDDKVLSKSYWSIVTYASCDQTAPVVESTAVSSTVTSADPVVVATVGESGDYVALLAAQVGTRTFVFDGALTEQWNDGAQSFRSGLADGPWTKNSHTVTHNTDFTETIAAIGLIIKALGGSGAGNIQAPVVTVSGAGDVGVNALKSAVATVAGVAERVIVWTAGVELNAPTAVTVLSASQAPDISALATVELTPVLFEFNALGAREVVGPGAASSPVATVAGVGPLVAKGTGTLTAALVTVSGEFLFTTTWYVSKSVVF